MWYIYARYGPRNGSRRPSFDATGFLANGANVSDLRPLCIGVDVDDVLVESLPGYLEAFRGYFGRTVKIEEAAWEIFNGYPDISADQLSGFFATLETTDFLATRPVYPDAVEAMHRLSQLGHRLVVVTGRFMAHRDHTRRLLEAAGIAHLFEEMVHRDGEPAAIYKPRVARERRLDLLIDDELHLAVATAAASVPVLLFDRPWNQGRLPAGVVRVHTWGQVRQFVETAAAGAPVTMG
jgi:uncharacterized HAD superfamily protein